MTTPDGIAEFVNLVQRELGIDELIDEDTPLVSSGLIDSFDVVGLLTVIEDHYQVVIEPEELDVEAFDTPAQMLAYIQAAL